MPPAPTCLGRGRRVALLLLGASSRHVCRVLTPGSYRERLAGPRAGSWQVGAKGEVCLGHLFHQLFSVLSFSLIQVYVSYDYGKSFKRISEKLSFGVGNSSEAVIAQFYHSPADNKRVRKGCPARCDFMGLNSGTTAMLKRVGGGGRGRCWENVRLVVISTA